MSEPVCAGCGASGVYLAIGGLDVCEACHAHAINVVQTEKERVDAARRAIARARYRKLYGKPPVKVTP